MADVKKVLKEVVEKVSGVVEVELHDAKEGFHTIFLEQLVINFVNGVAKVEADVAKKLKEHGYIK